MSKPPREAPPAQNPTSYEVDPLVSSLNNQIWARNVNTQSNVRVLNANELTSISALITYIAHNSGEPEFRIARRLSDRFNVANVTRLPSDHYDDAIRFLVDNGSQNTKI